MHVWRAAEAPPPTRMADELSVVNVLNQVSARLIRNEKYNHILNSQKRKQNLEKKTIRKWQKVKKETAQVQHLDCGHLPLAGWESWRCGALLIDITNETCSITHDS
jgi:hypothetical protein